MNSENIIQRNSVHLSQEQRLRSAIKILVDYLVEHGHIEQCQPLMPHVTDHAQNSANMAQVPPRNKQW